MKNLKFIPLILLALFSYSAWAQPFNEYLKKPKLVVAIVIDQFRADYLTKYQSRFQPAKSAKGVGGFNFLFSQGAWIPQAHYTHLQNMTGPGHSTILSGANTYLTGIPVNEWYDTTKKKPVYCVSDDDHVWLSGSVIDRTGTSPKNFFGSTVGDELKNFNKNAKVVSLSLKDRAAILMGGKRSDVTIWMDPSKLIWTSSTYYYPEKKLPSFVLEANSQLEKLRKNSLSDSPYFKNLQWEKSVKWNQFPEKLTWGDKNFPKGPAGLAILEALAETAVTEMKLGKGNQTDLLSVSFSAHDYAGHMHGAESPQMEEMTIADDIVLAKLFNFLAKAVPGGLENVAIVLTADHGVAPNPEISKKNKVDSGRASEDTMKKNIETALIEKFGKQDEPYLLQFKDMNLFLNHKLITEEKIGIEKVENEVVRVLEKEESILRAFSYHQFLEGKLPPGIFKKQILNTYFPGRSGDVIGILKPFYVSDTDTAVHQTGYSYDSNVPILFYGRGVKSGVYPLNAEVIDIAPTLSYLTGVLPPALSEGRVLSEILK